MFKRIFWVFTFLIISGLSNASDRLIIKWKDANHQVEHLSQFLTRINEQKTPRSFSVYEFNVDNLTPSQKFKIILELKQNPNILWLEEDKEIKVQALPGEYSSNTPDWVSSTNLDEAWNTQTSCSDVYIAVLDSGVNVSHEDLGEQIWINSAEQNGMTGVDDDNNGYTDDIQGYNVIDSNGDVNDTLGHGTHVTGIIAAVGNNATGIAGACWDNSNNANIIPVKFLNEAGIGQASNAANAIDYVIAVKESIQVSKPDSFFIINNSWISEGYSQTLKEAFDRASEAGILLVNAAGNDDANVDTSPVYPAYWSQNTLNSITVANLDQTSLDLHSSSSFGANTVTLAAPGTSIYSTYIDDTEENPANDIYSFQTGTSMATPVVTGVAALLWNHQKKLAFNIDEPTLSAEEIRTALEIYNTPLFALNETIRTQAYVNAQTPLEAFGTNSLSSQQIINLGFVYSESGTLYLNGVNLDLLAENNPLTLNGSTLDTSTIDENTLQINQPETLRCGFIQAQNLASNIDSTKLYLDWAPSAPSSLQLTDNGTTDYTLSWAAETNVDEIEIYTAGTDGVFSLNKTIANTTQTTTLSDLSDSTRIKLKSVMNCKDRNNADTTQNSAFSAEVIAGNAITPVWSTQSLSAPIANKAYYAKLFADNTHFFSKSTNDTCGLTLSNNVLSGTLSTANCDLSLIAHNDDYNTKTPLNLTWTIEDATQLTATHPEWETSLSLSATEITSLPSSMTWSLNDNNQWVIDFYQSDAVDTNQLRLTHSNPNIQFASAALNTNSIGSVDVVDQEINLTLTSDDALESNDGFDRYQLIINIASTDNRIPTSSASTDSNTSVTTVSSGGSGCYIASSVYGSYKHPQVEALRNIRDQIIAPLPGGQAFIELYYEYSPRTVEWLKAHPSVAKIVNPITQSVLDGIIWLYKTPDD